jgi:hypothetical protein
MNTKIEKPKMVIQFTAMDSVSSPISQSDDCKKKTHPPFDSRFPAFKNSGV